jgi:hypothetical protein
VAAALNHVGVERALGQELDRASSCPQFVRLLGEDADELVVHDAPLLFRIGHGEASQEAI